MAPTAWVRPARCVPSRGGRLNGVCSGRGLVGGEEDLLGLVVLGVQFPVQRRDLFRCGGARLAADPRADRYVADLYPLGAAAACRPWAQLRSHAAAGATLPNMS